MRFDSVKKANGHRHINRPTNLVPNGNVIMWLDWDDEGSRVLFVAEWDQTVNLIEDGVAWDDATVASDIENWERTLWEDYDDEQISLLISEVTAMLVLAER